MKFKVPVELNIEVDVDVEAVIASLGRRDNMSRSQAESLVREYNRRLVKCLMDYV